MEGDVMSVGRRGAMETLNNFFYIKIFQFGGMKIENSFSFLLKYSNLENSYFNGIVCIDKHASRSILNEFQYLKR